MQKMKQGERTLREASAEACGEPVHISIDARGGRDELAIRPAVVNRKVWGGNRIWDGAHVQSIVSSVLVTCGLQGLDALEFLSGNLKFRQPITIPIATR